MDKASEETARFRALKAAIEEGMADVEADRVVPWNLEDLLKEARERVVAGRK